MARKFIFCKLQIRAGCHAYTSLYACALTNYYSIKFSVMTVKDKINLRLYLLFLGWPKFFLCLYISLF
ncbi:hypothetical protein BBB56_20655 [Candidatus Pantoea deserta]|uniref:Uncharacterized protein n=1 Tax=Candidatus Pantoea deserta TaxID=1869313 RepID=A0A3N4NR16_9GAMM|nr:hypothetical protein BBB56_20655 [Pantoea deserta]